VEKASSQGAVFVLPQLKTECSKVRFLPLGVFSCLTSSISQQNGSLSVNLAIFLSLIFWAGSGKVNVD